MNANDFPKIAFFSFSEGMLQLCSHHRTVPQKNKRQMAEVGVTPRVLLRPSATNSSRVSGSSSWTTGGWPGAAYVTRPGTRRPPHNAHRSSDHVAQPSFQGRARPDPGPAPLRSDFGPTDTLCVTSPPGGVCGRNSLDRRGISDLPRSSEIPHGRRPCFHFNTV